VLVSHSQLSTYRTCPRKWKHVYVDRRVPRGPKAEALRIGSSIDEALKTGTLPDDPAERAMILGWQARWRDSGLTIDEVDVYFTHTVSPGIEVNGEIDAIGTDANGQRVAIEWKTTSYDIAPGSQYWKRVMLIDPQVSTYLAASRRELGIAQVVYDVLRKPALRLSKKETPDEFHTRCLEDIAARPEHYYQRNVIVRLEADHREFVRDVVGTVHLMQTGETPRNPNSCFLFRECEYFGVCAGGVRLDDDNIFMDRKSSHGNPGTPAADRPVRPAEDRQVDFRGDDAGADRYRF